MSVVARARIEEESGETRELTDLELLMFFNLLGVAGSETTRNSITLGMVASSSTPNSWRHSATTGH